MEKQGGCENPAQCLSSTLGMNTCDLPCLPEDCPNLHFTLTTGINGSHLVALPSPEWILHQQTSCNPVKFLGENSIFPYQASLKDVPEDFHSSLGGILPSDGVSDIQREMLHYNSGKAIDFEPANFSLDLDAWKAGFLRSHNGGEPSKNNGYREYWNCVQIPNGDNYDGSLPRSRETGPALGVLSKTHKSLSRQRATANDRLRRLRIAENFEALQQLLPHSEEVDKASLLDNAIERIKFLQLQIKELSRCRLGDESTSEHYLFLEGYGHYDLHGEHMLNEPLEDTMGKLLEVNPSAAALLLKSRGLYVMPMVMADGFTQAE